MLTIGEQIKAARKQKGYTQDALASRMSLSRQAISHWESGRTMPDAETLLRLSSILDFHFDSSIAQLPVPALQQSPLQEASLVESLKEELLQEKRKNRILLWCLCGFSILIVVFLVLYFLVSIGNSDIYMEVLNTPLHLLEESSNLDGIPGWEITLSMHNQSRIPFTPNRIIALFYCGERIAKKSYVTYSDMRPWMDSDKMFNADTPLHWLFCVYKDDLTHAEFILQGTDDHGHELEFRTSVPLYCEIDE